MKQIKELTANYAIKPTPEQALGSNRTQPRARLIAALGLMISLTQIEGLVSNPEKEVFIADSGWFTDPSAEVLEQAWMLMERQFEDILDIITLRLGKPDFTEMSDPKLRDAICQEAMRIAGWKQGNGYAVLVMGQHDRETPVFVSFGYRREA